MIIDNNIANQIIENNNLHEERNFSSYACKSSECIRRYPNIENISDLQNIRPAFFHDTDRIIHSFAYSRYIDKTQVFFLLKNDHITHRVLHVQFVSKIARVIGRCLQLNEDLIEAIALGHDIGHTPYGHDGERYLNQLSEVNNLGHFCHNAQSVRFLMELEKKGKGLNLTLQVLDGILCHNGELLEKEYSPHINKTWDIFLEQYKGCWEHKDYTKKLRPMTLEGCVVRICDIIAYIGRDLEDAIKVNLLNRSEIPEEITNVLGNCNDDIINNLVIDLLNNSYGKDCLNFSNEVFDAIKKLKEFSAQNIYLNPKLRAQDEKISNMFSTLYEKYIKDLKNNNSNSTIYQHVKDMDSTYIEKNSPHRIVLDYISGMTDQYFNNEFSETVLPKSFGHSFK